MHPHGKGLAMHVLPPQVWDDIDDSLTMHDNEPCVCCTALYVSGRKPPHYPVPAIQYEIEYYPDPLIVLVELINDLYCLPRKRWVEYGCFDYGAI